MKKFLIFALILLLPLSAFSHPGRTDKRGGHRCWKDCGDWGLDYKEYHLHDKNWKPIRLDKSGNPIVPSVQMESEIPKHEEPSPLQSTLEDTPNKSAAEEPVPKVEKRTIYINTTIQESLPFNPLLIPLLFLLFLALILIRRKRKDSR